MSSEVEEKTKEFMKQCTQDCLKAFPSPTLELISQYTTIQIIGKMFELEAKIKELEND